MKATKILAVLAVLALALAGPAMSEEGVTDNVIHLGSWGPQTGPAAAWGSVPRGTDAYFKMINDEGGIHGRRIVFHMFDDGYNPARTKAGVKKLQEEVGIFAWAGGVGTAPGLAVKDYLMDKGVIWVSPAAGSLHWINPPQKTLFSTYPLYYTEAKALTKYALENLGSKKVAIIYQNDDYGKNGLKGAKEQLAKNGMELVAEVPVEKGDSDLKPHVLKLRKSGADMVLLWVNPKHAIMTVGISKAMKFSPKFMSTSTCSDYPLMVKISKGLWEGVITTNFAELPASKSPLMKKYRAAYEKYAAPSETWGTFYYAGFGFAEPLVEAIRRAGPDLTREKVVAELEKMQNFQGVGGQISFKPFDPNDPMSRQGQNEVFLTECMKDGSARRLTGWMTVE